MKISLLAQHRNPTRPLAPCGVYTGSAFALDLEDVPSDISGGNVTSLSVTVTNADGQPLTGTATKVSYGYWYILFAATGFEHYGFVSCGVKVTATVTRPDNSTASVVIGVGDLRVKQATATAQPGEPTTNFVVKGSDVYLKSQIVSSVQHYVKQVMAYDADIGWGANWTGDYILVNGEFVPYTQPVTEV